MHQMTDEQIRLYLSQKLSMEQVRRLFSIPEERYCTVSIWPKAGQVRVNENLTRVPAKHKISKSDQAD